MSLRSTNDAPRILSIQSQLVFGCAGNNAAVPLLQALGATVYAVPTILLSNTPHYETVATHRFPASDFDALLQTTMDRLPPTALDGILVGYLSDSALVPIVSAFIDKVRQDNPSVTVLVDPVMGDMDLGFYVPEGVSERLCAELVPRADIITPNVFEAGVITGCRDQAATQVLSRISELDTPVKLVTGLGLETPGVPVSTQLWQGSAAWTVSMPHIPVRPTGTGDLLAAAFLYHWLMKRPASEALRESVAMVHGLLQSAVKKNLPELQPWLIGSQGTNSRSMVQVIPLESAG